MPESMLNTEVLRHCPKCGQPSLTSANQYLFVCRACDFHLYLNAGGTVVGVIKDDRRRLLFVTRGKEPALGKLDLPGGFIDHYETAEAALQREIREELNLQVRTHQYLFSAPNRYPYREVLYHTVDLFFLCTVSNLNELRPNDELQDYAFYAPDEIPTQEIGFASIRQGVEWLQQKIRRGEIIL